MLDGPGRREQVGSPAVYSTVVRGTLYIDPYGNRRVVIPTQESVLQDRGSLIIHAKGPEITGMTFKRDANGQGSPGIFRGVFLTHEQDARLLKKADSEGKTPEELIETFVGEGLGSEQNGHETAEILSPQLIPLIVSQTS